MAGLLRSEVSPVTFRSMFEAFTAGELVQICPGPEGYVWAEHLVEGGSGIAQLLDCTGVYVGSQTTKHNTESYIEHKLCIAGEYFLVYSKFVKKADEMEAAA